MVGEEGNSSTPSKMITTPGLLHAASNGGGAAVYYQASVSVEDFIYGGTVKFVILISELDQLCEPLPSGPNSCWVKQESL